MNRFDTFTLSIMALNRQVQQLKDTEMARFGLKGSYVMPMYFLGMHHEDGLTSAELSKLCMEDKAAISRTLKKLESLNIVCPVNASPDKRDYRVKRFLSDYGYDIFQQMTSRIGNAVAEGGSGISEAHKKILYKSLLTISNNLSNLIQEEE